MSPYAYLLTRTCEFVVYAPVPAADAQPTVIMRTTINDIALCRWIEDNNVTWILVRDNDERIPYQADPEFEVTAEGLAALENVPASPQGED